MPAMSHKSNPYKKATSMFRWKWKKKRTRRLQKKRRKLRERRRGFRTWGVSFCLVWLLLLPLLPLPWLLRYHPQLQQ